jgi:hypothetical protein
MEVLNSGIRSNIMELWKDIAGLENYQASDAGRIRTLDKVTGITRVLSQHVAKHGKCLYLEISLNGKHKSVHQLVCEAFHGPRPEGYDCRHLNNDSFDNCADNLRWGTRSENEQDKYRCGRGNDGERHHLAKLTEADVIAILQSDARSCDLCKKYGVGAPVMSMIRSGKSWKHIYAKFGKRK